MFTNQEQAIQGIGTGTGITGSGNGVVGTPRSRPQRSNSAVSIFRAAHAQNEFGARPVDRGEREDGAETGAREVLLPRLLDFKDIAPPPWPLPIERSAQGGIATTPPAGEFRRPRTPSTSTRKRPLDVHFAGPTSDPASKRPRLKSRVKYNLDNLTFANLPIEPALQPPSPLFFSNSPHPRPNLPPRFSSSEAAARMLSKARGEDTHVKTVSLARGTVTSTPGGSVGPTSAPLSARRSIDRSSLGRSNSPDSNGAGGRDADVTKTLNSIGIIELLEQDERPTFIVDLSEQGNYDHGQLSPLFANSALRMYDGLLDFVQGHGEEDVSPGGRSYVQFKAWLLSATANGESLNVCLPSYSFAGMLWTCSTLRKRLRIISGTFESPPGTTGIASKPPSVSVWSSPARDGGSISAPLHRIEPSDYFGAAAPPPRSREKSVSDRTPITIPEVVPSIESVANKTLHAVDEGPMDLSGSTDLLPTQDLYVPDTPSALLSHQPVVGSDNNWFHSQFPLVPADAPSFDWTRLPITDAMPEHIKFARSVDWGATSLGPIEYWSSDLRQMCNLIMASPHPAAMYWGDDLIAIYNEAYIMLAGQKHPKLMGQSYSEAWSEIWHEVEGVFANARLTGEATMKDDDCLFMKRSDFLEETYFSWSIIPMVGGQGSVMGLYNPAFEKTRRKIAERRMLTLREVGERTASARDVTGFWAQVLGAFEFNEYDSPFLLLYSVMDETDSDASSAHSNSVFGTRQCFLEGSLGVPEDHPCAPAQIELRNGMEGFGPVFREVMKTDRPKLLQVGTEELPASLLEGLDIRGFGDPCTSIVVCPIHPTTGETSLGFVVLGVNPRRPYDDDYSLFVQLLARQLATSLASVVLFEEEIRRGQRAAKLAALDRIELSEQLAARTQEAIDSETKFTRMAEFAPVGMFIASAEGKVIFANDAWHDLSRVPKGHDTADGWLNAVKEEDLELVKQLWRTVVEDVQPVSNEFRFKAQWEGRSGVRSDTWVLFSAYPERYADGTLKIVFGSITNISQQKWAEGIQTRKMEEAVELKRQQENFIDITSHEMRNPLSAILQCADEITTRMTQWRQNGKTELSEELIADCLDAAQTINLCSQHQKRIVDDILTLSKLDSALLLVTPVDSQPLDVVRRALKMHEGELQAADIQMKLVVDPSYEEDWVRFDPSRVLQVLINLTTNAIKFTSTEKKRTITVTIAASKTRPKGNEGAPVKYFASRNRKIDSAMEDKEWGTGKKVYIHFSVRDTGRGLSPEEKKMLFLRFSQASPRTHVQYGGSGLGLFISRELTELQGGEIGVESEAGKGSIFAFYVAARRSQAPSADLHMGMGAALKKTSSDAHGKKSLHAGSSKGTRASLELSSSPIPAIKKRVLIVEDNLVNQKVLQKQLKSADTEVHVANHGGEALEKLLQSTYCNEGGTLELGVVLMDQEMPVMDGLTCTKKIREMEREGKIRVHVPIIAVTANARSEQIATALDAGMDDVMSKPFRIPDLVPKIEELMLKYPMPSGPAGP